MGNIGGTPWVPLGAPWGPWGHLGPLEAPWGPQALGSVWAFLAGTDFFIKIWVFFHDFWYYDFQSCFCPFRWKVYLPKGFRPGGKSAILVPSSRFLALPFSGCCGKNMVFWGSKKTFKNRSLKFHTFESNVEVFTMFSISSELFWGHVGTSTA